jgi:hypothetical protein
MSRAILDQCLEFLKREDVKQEMKTLLSPIASIILGEIYPYVLLCLIIVTVILLLHLGIFIMVFRHKNLFVKNS